MVYVGKQNVISVSTKVEMDPNDFYETVLYYIKTMLRKKQKSIVNKFLKISVNYKNINGNFDLIKEVASVLNQQADDYINELVCY